MDFYSKQRRVRRQAHERDKSMREYMEHKEDYDMHHKARTIISTLSRISYSARELAVDEILYKVETKSELDFYYRWCFKLC